LPFPIKIVSTCPQGVVVGMSIPCRGADPVHTPMEEVAIAGFPITITCIGENGKKLIGIIDEPQQQVDHNANQI
jgi:hypothetical protein